MTEYQKTPFVKKLISIFKRATVKYTETSLTRNILESKIKIMWNQTVYTVQKQVNWPQFGQKHKRRKHYDKQPAIV